MIQFNSIKPIFKIPLKYGLIGSLFGVVLIVVLFYSNRHPLLIPPMFDFRIILFGLFIFFGLKEFREYHNGGILNFWQGMVISFIMYMIIGIVVGLFIISFSNLVPEFLEGYITGTIKGMELEKSRLLTEGKITISEEEYSRQMMLLKETSPALLAVDYIIKSCFIGFFLAIIISVILRRTEKRF